MISDTKDKFTELLLNEMQLSHISGRINSYKSMLTGSIIGINHILEENPDISISQKLIEISVILKEAKNLIVVAEEKLLEIQGELLDECSL